MGLADNFLRQIETLEKALSAKRSGLPERLVVLVYSDAPKDVEDATQHVFARYGVSREIAEAAGSQVVLTKLPFFFGRKIGISSRNDPRVMNELRGDKNTQSEVPTSAGMCYSGATPQVEPTASP